MTFVMGTSALMLVFMGSLVFVLANTATGCPFLCTCEGDLVECGGIGSFNGVTFPKSARRIKINGGAIPYIRPNVFGEQTEHVEFLGCKIGDIQPGAFSNLPKLKSMEFRASIVKRILSCGIHSISNAESIAFTNSMIEEILPGSISNLTGLANLIITATSITQVASFGFHNIQADKILFRDVEIELIRTAAFSELHNIESFTWSRVNSHRTEAGAFFRVQGLSRVEISGSFRVLKHQTLMELREATPGNHEGFEFKQSILSCDCRSAPLLEYIQANLTAADRTVICAITGQPVVQVRPEQVCPDYNRDSYCEDISLRPPACSSSETSTSSPSNFKVTFCPTEPRQSYSGSSVQTGQKQEITTRSTDDFNTRVVSKQEQNRDANHGAKIVTHMGLMVVLVSLQAYLQQI